VLGLTKNPAATLLTPHSRIHSAEPTERRIRGGEPQRTLTPRAVAQIWGDNETKGKAASPNEADPTDAT
jgi:hypothetical protein